MSTRPTPYTITLDEAGASAIEFARGHYQWADACACLEIGVNHLTESEAWEIDESLWADGAFCPCLNEHSALAAELIRLSEEIV